MDSNNTYEMTTMSTQDEPTPRRSQGKNNVALKSPLMEPVHEVSDDEGYHHGDEGLLDGQKKGKGIAKVLGAILPSKASASTNGDLGDIAVPIPPVPQTVKDGKPLTVLRGILCGSFVNWLLILTPLGIISKIAQWNDVLIFTANFLPIISLAYLLGIATEEVAHHTNEVIGGFLNATFGNATELILALACLRHDEVTLVRETLLGSILSNMLLVLGMSFFLGGLRHKQQTFNTTSVHGMSGMLLLACMALALPSVYLKLNGSNGKSDELVMSHMTSIGLAIMYGMFLYYQMGTHSHLFEDQDAGEDGGEEEEEEEHLPLWWSVGLMGIVTIFVALHSEFLVDAVKGTVEKTGINERFIGVVLLPIIGNAAEHASAVTSALKNKVTLSVAISLGSATQISVCVVPLTVLVGWMMGVSMDLNFHVYEVACLVSSVLLVGRLVQTGISTWLEGALLMVAYFLIGAGFLFLSDDADTTTKT